MLQSALHPSEALHGLTLAPRRVTPAIRVAEEAIARGARVTIVGAVKRRARDFLRRPYELETIAPGLSQVEPAELAAEVETVIRHQVSVRRRWSGFGGETPAINLRAARLAARVLRRAERTGALHLQAAE